MSTLESDAVWNDKAMELTGLSDSDPHITSTRGVNGVWALHIISWRTKEEL